MSEDVERQIREAAWSKARRMTWAMAPAPALYVLAGFLLLRKGTRLPAPRMDDGTKDAIFLALIAAGVACVAAAVWLARRLRRTTPPASLSAAAQRFVQTHVLTLALAECPAVLGLAYFLLTGDLRRMIVLAAAGMILLFFFLPSRPTLEALVRRGGPAGDALS